jgi:hypothetical protein
MTKTVPLEQKQEARFKKPKILTLDLPPTLAQRLRSAGYGAESGSLGRPYKIGRSDGYMQIVARPLMPNYEEQEIIIVDLEPPMLADGPAGEKFISTGDHDWYVKAGSGVIDPRPRVMLGLRSDSDRILKSGGVFVIFAKPRSQQDSFLATALQAKEIQIRNKIDVDNWSLLSILSAGYLQIESDEGNEIKVLETGGLFSSFLRKHLAGATFHALFNPLYVLSKNGHGPLFLPLACNKYGNPVAGILLPRNDIKGTVLILPQLQDKEAAVIDLIQNVLPEFSPKLFPDHEGGRWIHRDEYEHPLVLERKAAQVEVERKAKEEVARLQLEIEAEHERYGFLHGLLTKSGENLVADVQHALKFIGFQKVVDVDVIDDAEANKQEDLQILDRSPSLLLEVKGITGMPTEGDTLQVTKYVLRRIRQWNRTDVVGLSLVNHQRYLPAMDRDHINAFTQQQVRDAKQNNTGLMTTYDLFRLIRGMIRWNWPSRAVQDVLYGNGRLSNLPSHYTIVGRVTHYWTDKQVVSIEVTDHVVRVGDRVGYLFEDGFFEEEVTSLQVERKSVSEALLNQRAGMKTGLGRGDIPVGTVVYLVKFSVQMV